MNGIYSKTHRASIALWVFLRLVSHAARSSECGEDGRCYRCDDLHDPLERLFLSHSFLLFFCVDCYY